MFIVFCVFIYCTQCSSAIIVSILYRPACSSLPSNMGRIFNICMNDTVLRWPVARQGSEGGGGDGLLGKKFSGG